MSKRLVPKAIYCLLQEYCLPYVVNIRTCSARNTKKQTSQYIFTNLFSALCHWQPNIHKIGRQEQMVVCRATFWNKWTYRLTVSLCSRKGSKHNGYQMTGCLGVTDTKVVDGRLIIAKKELLVQDWVVRGRQVEWAKKALTRSSKILMAMCYGELSIFESLVISSNCPRR